MKLPVLLYHDIRNDDFDISSVEPALVPYILKKSQFMTQMRWLYDNKYETIALDKITKHDNKTNGKAVCIVFDDGWESNYEIAYPILKQSGFKATFFVTVNGIGKSEMMSWSQLKESINNGMGVGSHGLTHRPLVELNEKELNYELSESKKILQTKLDKKINLFSSPTGFFDLRIEKFARKNGYNAIGSTRAKLTNIKQGRDGIIRFNKIGIKRSMTIKLFKNIVNGKKSTLFSLRSRQFVRDSVKVLLGQKRYDQLKSEMLKVAQ